nr:metallophosphoesterase [Candidatus Paceibacterota bacterium]
SNYCGSSTSASKSITGLTASTTYSGSTGSTAGFTVLAYNSAGVYSSPATWLTVTTPSSSSCGGTNSAPTVSITGPTSSSSYTSSSSTISLSGTATDDVSVASVTWQNQTTGATGTATGTSSWSTSAITLQGGVNTIIVTARDGANPSLTGTDTITVTYGTPSVSSWPASNTGTQIGGSLTSLFEPSGAFWNPADQMLYFASDHGMITKMNQNGGSLTSWSVSGNFEGITGTGGNASYTASMDKVYVIDENTSQIKEIGPTGTITKTWTLPSNVTSQLDVSGNLGAEGITWVPNGSHPYGNTATGGIFYVGSQKDGKIFAVEVDLSLPSGTLQSTALKGTIQPQLITPGTANLSDIAYIPSTNKLIAIYDGLNIIHEMLPNGFIIGEYRLPVVSGASGEEGIAMIPTCNGTQTTIVLGYDPSGAHNVYKFSNYPQPCADSAGPLVTNKAVNVSQSGSTYTAAITWDTNEYSDSKIEYGVGNYGTTYFETPLKTTAHFVALSGLPTGQTYQYKITSRDQAGNPSVQATGTFNTGTVSGTSKVVVAAGDISCDYCNQMQVSNWIMNNIGSIDAVLPLGDLTYGDTSDNNPADGTLGAFNDYYAPSWGRPAIRAKTNPSPGNHEYYVSNASGYFDYFNGVGVNTGMAGTRGQGYYSYNVGDWHLLSLNSNEKCTVVSCGAGSAQETWMRSDLDANNSLCEIAYWHHPRFSNGDHGDTSAVDALWKAAADKGVDIILTGHDHGYERLKPMDRSGALNANGIRSFVVGSGGMVDFYPITTGTDQDVRIQNTNGILKLTLHSTSYEWQFVRTSDGVVLDSSPAPVSCH